VLPFPETVPNIVCHSKGSLQFLVGGAVLHGDSPLRKLNLPNIPSAYYHGGARTRIVASRLMSKQHLNAAMRGIASNGHLSDFFPLAFAGQVHGVHNVRWAGCKAPRKALPSTESSVSR